jgi:hypothetical protein
MRALLPLALCCLLAVPAVAQRGGGGHGGGFGGGGFHGGGFGGGGFHGGGFGGGGFHGGFGGFRGFGFNRFGYNRFGYGYGYPYWGWGVGWGYPYWGYGYAPYDSCWDYASCYPYGYSYAPGYGYDSYAAPAYSGTPGVTVISVPQSTAPAYVNHASPVTHEYDQYGQEVGPAAGTAGAGTSPIYLIAFNDHNIRAAQAYWIDGQILHYVTLQHEERQIPLSDVDRKLTLQLNHERHIPFQLP